MSRHIRVAMCWYRLWLFWACISSAACSSDTIAEENPIAGYTFEVIMAKLDYLQYKLHEVELGLKENNEEIAEKLQKIESSIETRSEKILAQQTACANHEKMRNEIAQLTQKLNHRKGPYTSCTDAPESVSGVYLIQMNGKSSPFQAFCEQNRFGGGWLVIQYRFDGSLDFYRNWTEYRNGFGSPYQEHWLGLERLYQLTSQGSYELLVELKGFNGSYSYALYSEFEIGSESEQYSLKKLGAFSGTAEDALSRQKGRKFSTKDRDNDIAKADCAAIRHGAWWYDNCADSNLNGKYMNAVDNYSIHWSKYSSQGYAYSRMMIRKI